MFAMEGDLVFRDNEKVSSAFHIAISRAISENAVFVA